MRRFTLLGILLLVMQATATAQGAARLAPHPSSLFDVRLDQRLAPFDRRLVDGEQPMNRIAPTYWREGAIVGGVLVGVLGASVAGGLCAMNEAEHGSCNGAALGGFVMGGLLGVAVGALIGGQFPK